MLLPVDYLILTGLTHTHTHTIDGLYWGLNALDIMDEAHRLPRSDVIAFVLACQDQETGGFGANVGYDPHLHYTLSALQILLIEDALDEVDRDKIADCEYRES